MEQSGRSECIGDDEYARAKAARGELESHFLGDQADSQAIFEFIATESTYNRDLQLIVNVYYASLLQSFPEMDEKALTVIFANIEDILLFNTGFLSSLEERQKSCRLYVDVIGDILAENAGGMGVYETWCVNQKGAEGVLRSLRGGDEGLRRHLEVSPHLVWFGLSGADYRTSGTLIRKCADWTCRASSSYPVSPPCSR